MIPLHNICQLDGKNSRKNINNNNKKKKTKPSRSGSGNKKHRIFTAECKLDITLICEVEYEANLIENGQDKAQENNSRNCKTQDKKLTDHTKQLTTNTEA